MPLPPRDDSTSHLPQQRPELASAAVSALRPAVLPWSAPHLLSQPPTCPPVLCPPTADGAFLSCRRGSVVPWPKPASHCPQTKLLGLMRKALQDQAWLSLQPCPTHLPAPGCLARLALSFSGPLHTWDPPPGILSLTPPLTALPGQVLLILTGCVVPSLIFPNPTSSPLRSTPLCLSSRS